MVEPITQRVLSCLDWCFGYLKLLSFRVDGKTPLQTTKPNHQVEGRDEHITKNVSFFHSRVPLPVVLLRRLSIFDRSESEAQDCAAASSSARAALDLAGKELLAEAKLPVGLVPLRHMELLRYHVKVGLMM